MNNTNPRPRLALVLGSPAACRHRGGGHRRRAGGRGHAARPDRRLQFGGAVRRHDRAGLVDHEALDAATTLWSAELTQQHRWRAYAQLLAWPDRCRFRRRLRLARRSAHRRAHPARFRRLADWKPCPRRCGWSLPKPGAANVCVLRHGALAQALRASIAVPVIFPSVEVDGGARRRRGVRSSCRSRWNPMPRWCSRWASRRASCRDGSTARLAWWRRRARRHQQPAAGPHRCRAQRWPACARTRAWLERHVGLWETRAMPYLFEAGRRAARAKLAQITALVRPTSQQAPGFGPIAA